MRIFLYDRSTLLMISCFKNSVISIHSQMKEYPGVFRDDPGIMFCIYCDKFVDWKHKSTINSHVSDIKHKKTEKI